MSAMNSKTCAYSKCPNKGKEDDKNYELKVCSRCKTVRYCGPDCQRKDWTTHKPLCAPMPRLLTPPAKKPIVSDDSAQSTAQSTSEKNVDKSADKSEEVEKKSEKDGKGEKTSEKSPSPSPLPSASSAPLVVSAKAEVIEVKAKAVVIPDTLCGADIKQISAMVSRRKDAADYMTRLMFGDFAREHTQDETTEYVNRTILRTLITEDEKKVITPCTILKRLHVHNAPFAILDFKLSSLTDVKDATLDTGNANKTLIKESIAVQAGFSLGKTAVVPGISGSVSGKVCAFFLQIDKKQVVYIEGIAIPDVDCTAFSSLLVSEGDLGHWEDLYGYVVSCRR